VVGLYLYALLVRDSVVPCAHETDLADLPAAHDLAGLLKVVPGALHGACLHHAAVLPRRLHHLAALFHGHGDGLLHVDVFPVLAGLDRHIRMPVIGCGDTDHVDALVVENLAEVLHAAGWRARARLVVRAARGGGDRLLQVRLVDVAHGGDLDVRLLHGHAQVRHAHAPHPDDGHRNAVVRAFHGAGKNLGGEGGGCAFDEVSAFGHPVIL